MTKADIRAFRRWHRAGGASRAPRRTSTSIYVYAGHSIALPMHFLQRGTIIAATTTAEAWKTARACCAS